MADLATRNWLRAKTAHVRKKLSDDRTYDAPSLPAKKAYFMPGDRAGEVFVAKKLQSVRAAAQDKGDASARRAASASEEAFAPWEGVNLIHLIARLPLARAPIEDVLGSGPHKAIDKMPA